MSFVKHSRTLNMPNTFRFSPIRFKNVYITHQLELFCFSQSYLNVVFSYKMPYYMFNPMFQLMLIISFQCPCHLSHFWILDVLCLGKLFYFFLIVIMVKFKNHGRYFPTNRLKTKTLNIYL